MTAAVAAAPSRADASVLDLLIRQAEGGSVTGAEVIRALLAGDCDAAGPMVVRRHHRVRVRDAALRAAGEVLRPGCRSAWELAARLEQGIHRFETRVLPRLWGGAEIELGPLDFHLRRAFLAGAGVPKSQRALFELVRF